MSACDDTIMLLAACEGRTLSEAEEANLHSHLDACSACHAVAHGLGPSEYNPGDEIDAGEKVAHYEVVRQLGSGGFGVVVQALDTKLQRHVALKILRPNVLGGAGRTSDFILREAQAMAKLSHPNVVTIFEVESEDDRVYIAMEYIDGMDLRQWLAAGPRPWREVISVYSQAAQGLLAAHGHQLIHRDFKPDNVLITESGRVLVTDFGLASVSARAVPAEQGAVEDDTIVDNLTVTMATGVLVGTPPYMAPEQHVGDKLDARADQYALAVSMWEGIFGVRPFAGSTFAALLAAKHESVPQPPEESGEHAVPKALTVALLRALEFIPGDRFDDLEGFLAAVDQAIASEAKGDAKATSSKRSAKSPSRRALFTALVTLALVGGVATFAFLASRGEELTIDLDAGLGTVSEVPRRPFIQGPIGISEIEISPTSIYSQDWLTVEAQIRINEEIGERQQIAAKLSCQMGALVIVESQTLLTGAHSLPTIPGQIVSGKARFFSRYTTEELPAPCELEFRRWPEIDRPEAVAWACFDGMNIDPGRCPNELQPSVPEAGAPSVEVSEVSLERVPGSTRFISQVAITHNQMPVSFTVFVSKLSCQVADKKIVAVDRHFEKSYMPLKPGESTLISARMYTSYGVGFEEMPGPCEFSVTQSVGLSSEVPVDTLLYQGCFDNEASSLGKCPGFGSATPAVSPTEKSVVVDRVKVNMQQGSTELKLNYAIDVTLVDTLPRDWAVIAEARCNTKSGRAAGGMLSVTKINTVELHRLVPGETSRARGVDDQAFEEDFRVDDQPCDIAFFLSPPPQPGRELASQKQYWVPVHQACYRAGNTSSGPCKRSGGRVPKRDNKDRGW